MVYEWSPAVEGVHYALYGLFALLSIGEVFRTFIGNTTWSDETRERRLVLYPILLLASATRIAWVQQKSDDSLATNQVKSITEDHDLGFVFCRLASTLFFCFLLAVVYSWYRIADSAHSPARVETAKKTFFLVGAGVFVTQALLTGAYVLAPTNSQTGYGNLAYEISLWTMIVLTALLSISFFIFGVQIMHGISQSEEHMSKTKSGHSLRIVGAKIVVVASSIGLCGLLRIVMFAYRPLTGKDLPGNFFYPWCFYFIPEALPTAMFLATSPSSMVYSALRYMALGCGRQSAAEPAVDLEADTQKPLMPGAK